MMKNILGVGVLVVCLLCLSPLSSLAQPGSELLHRMAPYPYIPMKVMRGFKRQLGLADRGMMMGLGKRGFIGDRGMMMGLGKRSSEPWQDFDTEY